MRIKAEKINQNLYQHNDHQRTTSHDAMTLHFHLFRHSIWLRDTSTTFRASFAVRDTPLCLSALYPSMFMLLFATLYYHNFFHGAGSYGVGERTGWRCF